MLLINFICLFYLMVLVRCDAISKSAANTESFDDVSDEFDKLYMRQDVPDPVSRSPKRLPRLRKLKRPWLFMVPIDSYQSTAALENILDDIKYKNMKQIASSPFGSTGMVFVTQPGYDRDLSGFSTVKPNILNKENKAPNKIDADDTTTELDEFIYIDNLSIKERNNKRRTNHEEKVDSAMPCKEKVNIKERKNKRRTNHEEKVDSAKPCKEKVKKKFQFKDYFKFLHPKGRKKEKEENKCVTRDKQDLLKEVPELSTDDVKSDTKHEAKTEATLSTSVSKSDASEKVQRHISSKEKSQQNRHQRDADTRESQQNNNWLSNFKKREPHSQALDSRVYESLSNKLAYKDFVDGYKYYLNFEKDMAKSNFSDLVKYQAHKHHRVDDIGKFILEKLPPVPTTISYETKSTTDKLSLEYEMDNETADGLSQMEKVTCKMERLNESADSDYGENYEKYDFIQTKSVPSTPYSINVLKKRLIDFRRPSWLGKSINSYSDSKTRSPRVRRHGIRFDTTQFPHSLKTERVLQKDNTKNVGFAKVNLVETAKAKKPYNGIFGKFKKHHSKRDTQRASRSNFLNKLKQLFANGQTTASTKSIATEGFDFQSHFYDIMKEQYPFYKASDTSDMAEEKKKKPLAQSHSNRFSLDDYGREPKGLASVLNDIPFELTTPVVQDPKLRKELRKLQQEHDSVASKDIDPEYDFTRTPKYQTPSMSDSFEPFNLKELEARVNEAHNWSKGISKEATSILPALHPEELESYDDVKDILKEQEEPLTTKKKKPDTMSQRPTPQHSTKSWDYSEFLEKQTDHQHKWQINEQQVKNKMKGSSEPWQTNELDVKNKIKGPRESWQTNEAEFKKKLNEHHPLKNWERNVPGVKNKQNLYQSSKAWQTDERELKNNLKDLSKPWQPHDLKLKKNQNDPRSPKINQKKEPDYRNNLKEQTLSKTWTLNDPELKNKVIDYDIDTKAILPSASYTPEVINKGNPANHFNIKPTMLSELSIDKMAFHVRNWSERNNTNPLTTDIMPIEALKAPEFDKTDENWSETPAEEEKKTNGMPGKEDDNPEFDKKIKTIKDMGFRVRNWTGAQTNDVINNPMNTLIHEVTTETREDIDDEDDDDYMKDDQGIDEKQKKTVDQSRYFLNGVSLNPYRGTEDDRRLGPEDGRRRITLKVKIGSNDDCRSTEERSPIHNKLLYDSVIHKPATNKVPYTKATETTREPDRQATVNAPPENLNPQKGEHKDITINGKVNVRIKQKQSRPLSPQPAAPHDLYDSEFRQKIFDVGITVTPTEKDKVTLPHFSPSPMLDRFNQEFPDFKKEGKLADMEVLVREWFEKHYPDLVKPNGQNNAKNPPDNHRSDYSRLVKNWLEQRDLNWKPTTKAMTTENPSSDKKEKLGIKGIHSDKHDKAIDIGRYIKDWLDKFDPDCAKLNTEEISNLKKEDITTLDVGRAVKDWLDSFDPDCAKTSTKALNTKNDHTLKSMKHRMFHVKQWSERDNGDDKTSAPAAKLSDANVFTREIPELDKPVDYTKKTRPNDEKPTTTPEKYTYLFEPFPSYNPLNPVNHENGPQVTKPGISREHPKPVSIIKPDKVKPKNNGTLTSPKTKEKVKSRPRKYHIVKTFDMIYTAHGNMPSSNQSFNNFEAFFKKYSNLKKRNLRKSHMAPTTVKTPILSKFGRQKRLSENAEITKNKEVCPSVTPDPEMVDERIRNRKRETSEKHVVKNVAALEVLMDMMKNNDEVQQTSVEKPTLTNHESTNSVQVHLALPGNVKRSLKRVRKIFTARLFSPVDLEYQIHSYDDTLETTTPSVLPSGMYLLVDNYNSTSPRANFMLGPIPNDLKLSQVLQQQYVKIAANPDLENKKAEETTQNDKFSKVTLSKEFVSAVNEHLVQLYEAFARTDTKLDETTPNFKKVTLNSDFITVNIQHPEESQLNGKSTTLKLHKREIKKAFPSKHPTKKVIWEKKESTGKRQTEYEVGPVNDEVMLELISEMNSLVEYMNEHCTEIQTYFRNNPSGGRKLRDTVRKVNKLVDKYSKNASAAKSYYYKSFNKIVRKRHTGELIDVPQNYIPSNLIDDIENLASYISNVTKFRVRFNEELSDGGNNLVGVVDKCVLGEDNRNERSVTKNDKDVYSLDKVKVNIICKTEATSTTPTILPQPVNEVTVHWFVDNVNDETKKQWSLKNLLWRNKHMNKKSRDLMSRSWKREVGTIDSPLIADTSGSFWSNYMHKFQKVSHLEKKRTSGETGAPMDNEKEIHPTKQTSATTYESSENTNGINKCSKGNSEITTSTGSQQLIKETSNSILQVTAMATPTVGATSEPSISVKKLENYSSETNTNENLNGKKERKIKPKHKEKHTKMTDTSKPITNKDKSTISIDNPVFNEDDDINSASAPPTRGHLTINNSNTTQSPSTNSNKQKEHVSGVKINNKSTFALKQLFKKIPGHNDKEKNKHSDVCRSPDSPSNTANIANSTASITPSLVRNVINQISKTGDRTFQHWDNDNIVKYSGDQNFEEGKETNNFNLSNEKQTVKNSLLKYRAGKAYGDVKFLLLSILQYETKRINNDTVFAESDSLNEEPGHKEESGKKSCKTTEDASSNGEINVQCDNTVVKNRIRD